MNDGLKVRGDVVVIVRDGVTGRQLKRYEIRNTITNLGLGVMVQLLGQRAADPSGPALAVGALQIGNGTTAPAATDTALADGSPVTILMTDSNKTPTITYPNFQLQFNVTASTSVANGKTLTEAGLFTAGSTIGGGPAYTSQLIAHQLNPAIVKTSGISVDYIWTISFST